MTFFLTDRIRSFVKLCRSSDGTVAALFGATAAAVIVASGAAIDMTRAYSVKTRLASALDAAGLAVGSSPGLTDAQLQSRLQKFFYANYPTTALGTPTALNMTIDHTNNVLTLSAQAQVNTTLMKLAGISTVTVAANSQITLQTTGLELAMVLDNTGSMISNNNIGALRNAATLLTNILFGANTTPNNLKIAVVPYTAAVNVGSIAPNIVSGAQQAYKPSDPTQWKGCVVEPNYPQDVQEAATPGQWSEYYWNSSADNQWTPIDIAISQSLCNSSHGPNLGCPTPIQTLTSDKQTTLDTINGIQAWCRGGTIHHIGLAWGWRVLSPSSPFSPVALPYNTPGWKKAAIIMTDGVAEMYHLPGSPNLSDYTAVGRLDDGRLGTTSASQAVTVLDNRLAEICASMKAKGITLYTVTFSGSATAQIQALFRRCATDPGKYFNAPTQADLQTAFQAIGNSLNNLRISK